MMTIAAAISVVTIMCVLAWSAVQMYAMLWELFNNDKTNNHD